MLVRLNFQGTYDDDMYIVEPSSTVRELKLQVSAIIGVPANQFWLTTEMGRILVNEETFAQAGIVDGEELEVNGVIDRVLPVYRPQAVHHAEHAGASLRSDLAKLQRLAL
jgi:hypothetical protein